MGEGISNYKAYEKTLKHYNLPNDTELTNKQFVYYLNLWSLIELLKYFCTDEFQFEIKKHTFNVCKNTENDPCIQYDYNEIITKLLK